MTTTSHTTATSKSAIFQRSRDAEQTTAINCCDENFDACTWTASRSNFYLYEICTTFSLRFILSACSFANFYIIISSESCMLDNKNVQLSHRCVVHVYLR